jgi:hypothetical protein
VLWQSDRFGMITKRNHRINGGLHRTSHYSVTCLEIQHRAFNFVEIFGAPHRWGDVIKIFGKCEMKPLEGAISQKYILNFSSIYPLRRPSFEQKFFFFFRRL